MGVLTAGLTCVLVLMPLAYVCALAAAMSRCAAAGILCVKQYFRVVRRLALPPCAFALVPFQGSIPRYLPS